MNPSNKEKAIRDALDALYSIYDEDTGFDQLFNALKIGRVLEGDVAALRECAKKYYERITKAADILERNGLG